MLEAPTRYVEWQKAEVSSWFDIASATTANRYDRYNKEDI